MLKRFLYTVALVATSSTTAMAQHGLNYWFDTPATMRGQAVWYGGNPQMWKGENKPERAGDTVKNPDQEWESQSLPIGNGSIGANIMGSVPAERITLNEKTL